MQRAPVEPPLSAHLERIVTYFRGAGLEEFPPSRTDLRHALADFIERRTPALLEPWLQDIGPAFGIPERD